MDPISQGAIGAVAPQAILKREKIRVAALLGCLAGMAPDLDVLIQSPTDPLLFLEYHRQFTHALAFVPLGAALVALALHGFVRRRLRFRETYLACLLGYATHGLLDACTSYGTLLLWPFSDRRVAWNNVSVVDPLFTLPLLSLVILATLRRRRAFAIAGLVWALGYLAFGAVQHQRAEAAGARLAAERGHQPVRLSAKTGFGNLLVWKVAYEHNGRFHVDGIRTGWAVTACPGASAARLDLRRDFPWLDAESQQARDVERFRWFSSGYLARDARLPYRIMDVRYSVVPNAIDPLWGIDLDRDAAPSSHVRYFADRRARAEQTEAYWRLLTGEDCPVQLDAPGGADSKILCRLRNGHLKVAGNPLLELGKARVCAGSETFRNFLPGAWPHELTGRGGWRRAMNGGSRRRPEFMARRRGAMRPAAGSGMLDSFTEQGA